MDIINCHRHFGVYGVCLYENKILVIKKKIGPYKNRYDLPGGSLEKGEALATALKREFFEETGFEIEILENIGIKDFFIPWKWKEFNYVHHIAVFYKVNLVRGNRIKPKQFEGQDSLGAVWIDINKINESNSSPLILEIIKWLNNKSFDIGAAKYENWIIK